MARKPSYDFERRERDKAKAAKKDERLKVKAEKKERLGAPEPEGSLPPGPEGQ